MAYKLGLMLSMGLMMAVLLLSGDLMTLTEVHSMLDAISLTVSYKIQSEGTISQATYKFVEDQGATLIPLNTQTPSFGDIVEYKICKQYQPMILSYDIIEVCVSRSAVVGYYLSR